jgi:hypothetical protein
MGRCSGRGFNQPTRQKSTGANLSGMLLFPIATFSKYLQPMKIRIMHLIKKIAAVCLLFFAISSSAQDDIPVLPVDYQAIDSLTKDSLSDFFYPKILKRYIDHDTTLTVADYHYLYYGYTFQEAYNSLSKNENDTLKAIFDRENLTEEDFKKVIELELEWLKTYPFDLEAIYLVAISYDELGSTIELEPWIKKFSGLMDAILASGDGMAVESAVHVIRVPDEYFVLDLLGFEYAGSQSLVFPCDYLEIEPNEFGIEGFYFNVERHFAFLSKELEEKK